ncbi:hypothetical protein R75461_05276 [Paraburkholderia nemoris]|uniref:hypothetical protein n=1 Tax=Paraburkholderia nemoris TaxID=2793076 RepID=UPI00190A2A4A|nr:MULTISPECIES: hypothetical protein [Paraburkholderia]MBK3783936.1 hypothetical protein [Paraburkholderia aspalathi]CAE6802950.1 hypothetical protein R75461_05276 [Paraburkholderia nemoris]
MSNEAIQKHLSQDAAQLIANASPALDKPDNCVKPAKEPTFVRPRLEYIEFFSKYTRSPYNAAKLYSYLVYHAQRNKPGPNPARLEVIREGGRWGDRGYWWVQTRKDIARACELTEDQFRSAMGALERADVAVHQRGRYYGRIQKYYGKTIEHFRLGVCARGNGLDCWPTVDQLIQMRIILGGDKPPLSSGDKPPALVQDALVVSDTEEGNIQNAGAGNTPASISPEKISEQSGKGVDPKKEQASEPFLNACLEKKLQFIQANDNGENTPCVLAELTPDDHKTAQRLEFELTKAGLDPLAFMGWLTLQRYQKYTLGIGNDADWSVFVIVSHREMFFGKYRAYVAEQGKFSSSQQIKLNAMAPKAMKLSIPLYEENPGLVAAMFGHADYWHAQQTDGQLDGRTLRQYLTSWSWITPAMIEWLDNEAVRERVEELLNVPKAIAA